jgi:hypothetical protein
MDTSATIDVKTMLSYIPANFRNFWRAGTTRQKLHPSGALSIVQQIRKFPYPICLTLKALFVIAPFESNTSDRKAVLPLVKQPVMQ